MENKTLLLGIGNPFRSDDGLGAHIVHELQKEKLDGLEYITNTTGGVDLLNFWSDFETVFLFDAVSSGQEPGHIFRLNLLEETLPDSFNPYSTHTFSIADVIELGRNLDQLPARIIMFGVEIQSLEHGQGLTPPVQQAAEQIIKRARAEITEITNLLEN